MVRDNCHNLVSFLNDCHFPMIVIFQSLVIFQWPLINIVFFNSLYYNLIVSSKLYHLLDDGFKSYESLKTQIHIVVFSLGE